MKTASNQQFVGHGSAVAQVCAGFVRRAARHRGAGLALAGLGLLWPGAALAATLDDGGEFLQNHRFVGSSYTQNQKKKACPAATNKRQCRLAQSSQHI